MKQFILALLLLTGCTNDPSSIFTTEEPTRPFKYKFASKVSFEEQFYGTCEAQIMRPPMWSENCKVNGVEKPDWLYLFYEAECGEFIVHETFYPCERALSRITR